MIEIITEAGYTIRISSDYTQVTKGGRSKRFIGPSHRMQAVEYVIKGER